MIAQGSKIINRKTKRTHIVDAIEVINGTTLVFTEDIKCFPIELCYELIDDEIDVEYKNVDTIELLRDLHLFLDISEAPSIPYNPPKSKNFFTRILEKLLVVL
jgi:hypothetical protein